MLDGAFDPDVSARLIAMPSYTPEYALGIRETEGSYKIFHLASQAQLWSYENLKTLREIAEAGGFPGQDENLADAIAEYESLLPEDHHDVENRLLRDRCPLDFGKETFWKSGRRFCLKPVTAIRNPWGPTEPTIIFSMRANGVVYGRQGVESGPAIENGRSGQHNRDDEKFCA